MSLGFRRINRSKKLNKALFQLVINSSEIPNPGRLIAVLAIRRYFNVCDCDCSAGNYTATFGVGGRPLGLAVAAATLMLITHLRTAATPLDGEFPVL